MALPAVTGWIIDFRTARTIFSGGNNQWISHCVGKCADGTLSVSHCEEDDFKSMPMLKAPFLDDNQCVVTPDDDIIERCISIEASPKGQKLFRRDQSAMFITAIAASKNLGVISDHRGFHFATVFDLCTAFGVPIYSATDYFNEAL